MMQFLTDNLLSILSFLFGGGGVLMWLLEKRRYNETILGMRAENEDKEIDNDAKLLGIYRDSLDDLGNRYEAKFKDVAETYERKIKLLEEEINLRERIILSLKRENRDLKKRIKDLENGVSNQ